ncbi:MAG: hypothetical protein R2764_11830 [Bacteroidales bacterium]
MNLQKIEHLIEKYENGETTTEEEQKLKSFFLHAEVPVHLRSYSDIFTFFEISGREEIGNPNFDDEFLKAIEEDKTIPIQSFRKKRLYTLVSIAAVIVILFGLYFKFGTFEMKYKDTYQDPKLAYAETKKVLMMVSGNLNDGVNELQNVSEFNKVEKFKYLKYIRNRNEKSEKISILDKSKEIITSKQ